MSNTDTDTDARYYPQPPPSPLTQVAQTAPQPSASPKMQDRLPGGNISFHSGNLGISGGPPETPIGNIPLPTPRPPEAPPYTMDRPSQRFTPHALRPRPETSDLGRPPREVGALEHYPGLEYSTLLPSRQEAYGVFRGGFKQMAQFGPPSVSGPAQIASSIAGIIGPFLDFYSRNAFSSHYRATRLGETQEQAAQQKMQHERLNMQMEQVKLLHAQMMEKGAEAISADSQIISEYADVFNKQQNGTITPEAAQEALSDLNQKHNHPTFTALLANGGPSAVMQELVNQHNRLSDAWGAYAVLDKAGKGQKEQEKEREKEEKQAEIEAPFRNAPGAAATTGAAGTTPTNIGGYHVPPTAAAAAETAAVAAADTGEPDLNSQSLDAADAAGLHNRGAINDLADQILNGDAKRSDYKGNDRAWGFAEQRAAEMRNQLNQIKRDPELKTKDDILNAIGGVSPTLKDKVNGILTGGIPTPQRGTAGAAKGPWVMAYSLAEKAEPNIANILQTRPNTLRYFTSGQGARQVAQLGTAYDHGKSLLNKLENMPPFYMQFMARWGWLPAAARDRMFPETSAAIGALEKDIQVFGSETGAVLAYGQGTGAERRELREGMNWATPNTTIAAVKDQLTRLRDRESNLGIGFKAGTGMDFQQFRQGFVKENPIMEKYPDAESGLDELERDKSTEQVQDYRTYSPGAR